MTTYLEMTDAYSTAIRQNGGSKMNQCQWFNLVTVCKDNFVLTLFTFRLSGPCINCAFRNAPNELNYGRVSQWNGFILLCTNIKTKRLIALMLCSADYTDDQLLYRLATEVDNRRLAGARGVESFRGRWLHSLRILMTKIRGPRRYRGVWELAVYSCA